MTSRRMRILNLLASGAITPEEADQLLSTMSQVDQPQATKIAKRTPRQICVKITNQGKKRSDKTVNFHAKVPVAILKTGIRFTRIIPKQGLDTLQAAIDAKGLPFDLESMSSVKGEQFDDLIRQLNIDTTDKNGNHIRVYWE